MVLDIKMMLCLLCLYSTADAETLDRVDQADRNTVRLSPSLFSSLPDPVSDDLEARGCKIPQTYGSGEPHNVIKGHFKNSETTDWAVLCSAERKTVLLVYWGGTTELVSEMSRSNDRNWLQTIDAAGQIGFSRSISSVDAKYITDHARWYGGDLPPKIDHEGINEAFIEKASVVYYWYKGAWLKLRGAD